MAVLVYTQGCAPLLVVGSVAGFGASYYLNNVHDRTFTAELPKVWDATLGALDTMAITVVEKEQDERRGRIQATTDDLKVDIVFAAVTSMTTRVSVDAVKPYFARDKATAVEIVEQINAQLEKLLAEKNGQKSRARVAGQTPPLPPTNGNQASATSRSPAEEGEFVEIKVRAANVRAAASMNSQVLSTLPRGTRLERTAEVPPWVRVRLSSRAEGFIAQRLVQQAETLPPSNYVTSRATPSPIPLAEDRGSR